ncbi:MAG: hypothetical protein IT440_02040 [Phycisphaeraceae bacterium]|nr:hypothetical protein [Phycisphaeraceae bacterium]
MRPHSILRCSLLLVLLFAAGSFAEDVPASDTLWCIDGSDIKTAEKAGALVWGVTDKSVQVRPVAEGKPDGVIFDNLKAASATGTYVKVDPAYPWLVWEVRDVQQVRGYVGFGFRIAFGNDVPPPMVLGQVSHLQKGIYAVDYTRQINQKADHRFFRLDSAGSTVTCSYIKMVRQPENWIAMESPVFGTREQFEPGDELTFKVTLKEPAKDVSVKFFHNYTMPPVTLNGQESMQLAASEGSDNKVWTTTVKAEELSRGNLKIGKQFGPGELLVKATVLGGGIKLPLWTGNPCVFSLVKWPTTDAAK